MQQAHHGVFGSGPGNAVPGRLLTAAGKSTALAIHGGLCRHVSNGHRYGRRADAVERPFHTNSRARHFCGRFCRGCLDHVHDGG